MTADELNAAARAAGFLIDLITEAIAAARVSEEERAKMLDALEVEVIASVQRCRARKPVPLPPPA